MLDFLLETGLAACHDLERHAAGAPLVVLGGSGGYTKLCPGDLERHELLLQLLLTSGRAVTAVSLREGFAALDAKFTNKLSVAADSFAWAKGEADKLAILYQYCVRFVARGGFN